MCFARVLIEIFASHEFKKAVVIEGPRGVSLSQRVEYEWVPLRCGHCQSFGHGIRNCKLPRVEIEEDDEEDARIQVDSIEESVAGSKGAEGYDEELERKEARGKVEKLDSPDGQGKGEAGAQEAGCSVSKLVCYSPSDESGNRVDLIEGSEGAQEAPFKEVKKKNQKKKKRKPLLGSEDSEIHLNLLKLSQKLKGSGKGKKKGCNSSKKA